MVCKAKVVRTSSKLILLEWSDEILCITLIAHKEVPSG